MTPVIQIPADQMLNAKMAYVHVCRSISVVLIRVAVRNAF